MQVQRITNYYNNTYKAASDKQTKRREYLNDAADGCIAFGLLFGGDDISVAKKESNLHKAGKIALVAGIALVVIRFCDKFFSNDKKITKGD